MAARDAPDLAAAVRMRSVLASAMRPDMPPTAALEAEPTRDLWPALADWIAGERALAGRGLIVGLCGPQGSGKSTGAAAIRSRLEARGLRCAVLGLDDLYLGKAERLRLAETVHPLFATRGPPGTHDVALGMRTLDALTRPGTVRLPRFDKARDDRMPEADWPGFEGPAEVVIFEGWCVGALPEPEARLATPVNALETEEDPDGVWRRYANAALAGPYSALFARLDRLIQLCAPDFSVVADWRTQQEHDLRARTGSGMTDDEVRRFVRLYERLTRWMNAEAPNRADVVMRLDAERGVTDVRVRR